MQYISECVKLGIKCIRKSACNFCAENLSSTLSYGSEPKNQQAHHGWGEYGDPGTQNWMRKLNSFCSFLSKYLCLFPQVCPASHCQWHFLARDGQTERKGWVTCMWEERYGLNWRQEHETQFSYLHKFAMRRVDVGLFFKIFLCNWSFFLLTYATFWPLKMTICQLCIMFSPKQ